MGLHILKILYVNIIILCNSGYNFFLDLFKTSSNEIVKEEKKETNKLKKVPTSMLHLVPRDHVDDTFYKFNLSPQKRDTCSCCNLKLPSCQKQYFAFDKEYCSECWYKINLK